MSGQSAAGRLDMEYEDSAARLIEMEARLMAVEEALLRIDAALDGLLSPPPVRVVPLERRDELHPVPPVRLVA